MYKLVRVDARSSIPQMRVNRRKNGRQKNNSFPNGFRGQFSSVDLFHVVDDPSNTPVNKKVTAEDVFNNIPSFLGLKQTSQSITADGSSTTAVDVTKAYY